MAASASFPAFALLVAAPLYAQSTATLQGRVFDSSGAVLPAATVSVRSDSTGFDRSVPTDDEGRYHAEAIPAGSYEVAAAASSLPPGSTIQFRDLSTWERYKQEIIVILGVLLLQSGLIAALLVERRSRRRSEMALRESEERAEIAGVSLGVGFWSWEPHTDQMWTTRQCAWLLGPETGKPLTLSAFLDALRPQIGEPGESAFEHAVRSGTPFDGEWPMAHADGRMRWIAAATRPSGDSGGHAHVTGVLMDITARKTAELQAEEHRRELAHLGRVAMLGEMSGALAHELRQPLMAIRSYAQGSLRLIGSGGIETASLRDGLQAIVKAEKHAGAVIDRTRALLKRNEPRPEELDINEVVRETLELASVELVARAVALSIQLAHAPPPVVGERVELQQVLMNVILNGCEAMSGLAPRRRRLHISTAFDEKRVQIVVRDAGTGIPEDRIRLVFEPFVTTKPDGLGLGLAICRSIVRALGGDIAAKNNPEGGATFEISLPHGVRDANGGTNALDDSSAGPVGAHRRR